MKKIIWNPTGSRELGTLHETPTGAIEGEFLGSPRSYTDWAEADARSELEAWRWHDARKHEPDDLPAAYS